MPGKWSEDETYMWGLDDELDEDGVDEWRDKDGIDECGDKYGIDEDGDEEYDVPWGLPPSDPTDSSE